MSMAALELFMRDIMEWKCALLAVPTLIIAWLSCKFLFLDAFMSPLRNLPGPATSMFLGNMLERHVLKPETTKRNGRNETTETSETTETKPPKRPKPPKRAKRPKPPKRPKRAKINGKVKKYTALISVTLLWQPDLAPLKSMHVCDIATSQLAGSVRSCKDD